MVLATVASGVVMVVTAEQVAGFLERSRMYEVLGLFVLLLVGVMLMNEGGQLAHLALFGDEIGPMNKATFYFVPVILVLLDVVQGRHQRKVLAEAAAKATSRPAATR
jgi:predicted tellurium resistance membrane protein TerC